MYKYFLPANGHEYMCQDISDGYPVVTLEAGLNFPPQQVYIDAAGITRTKLSYNYLLRN